MSKYVVETFYTCTFKIIHKLDELNEKKLSELENRKDGEFELIDVKLNIIFFDSFLYYIFYFNLKIHTIKNCK